MKRLKTEQLLVVVLHAENANEVRHEMVGLNAGIMKEQ